MERFANVASQIQMNKIFESASKIVFILLAVASCIGLFTGYIGENNFMLLATGAFAFYFSNKGDTSGNTPYAGK